MVCKNKARDREREIELRPAIRHSDRSPSDSQHRDTRVAQFLTTFPYRELLISPDVLQNEGLVSSNVRAAVPLTFYLINGEPA